MHYGRAMHCKRADPGCTAVKRTDARYVVLMGATLKGTGTKPDTAAHAEERCVLTKGSRGHTQR